MISTESRLAASGPFPAIGNYLAGNDRLWAARGNSALNSLISKADAQRRYAALANRALQHLAAGLPASDRNGPAAVTDAAALTSELETGSVVKARHSQLAQVDRQLNIQRVIHLRSSSVAAKPILIEVADICGRGFA